MNLISRDFFDDAFGLFDNYTFKSNIMKTDISIKDNNYIMKVDIPGFKKDEISINYDNGYITISAIKENTKEENEKYIRKERYYGEYKRTFYIGKINQENIKASYNDGTLCITYPKEEEKKEIRKQIIID